MPPIELPARLGPVCSGIVRLGLSVERQCGDRENLKRWRGGSCQEPGWGQVAKSRACALRVVMASPLTGFLLSVTPQSGPTQVETLIPEFTVEALDKCILHGLARFHEPRVHARSPG